MSLGVLSSFKRFLDQIGKRELTEKELEIPLQDLRLRLVDNDVAYELAEKTTEHLKRVLVGQKAKWTETTIRTTVVSELKSYLISELPTQELDLLLEARKVIEKGTPFVIMFIGTNGSGKSTTLAKFGHMYATADLRPILVCSDTYRAGALEQLQIHSNRLGLPLIGGKRGDDPAAVSFKALQDAASSSSNVLLIDTAGRLQTDINLTNELRKIKRVVEPSHTILVVDALIGNDAWDQAKLFEESVGFDSAVLAKFDADVKGGAALSVAYSARRPISYVGVGQRYTDLRRFSMLDYIEAILSRLM